MNLEGLKKEMPFQWRIQSCGKSTATASCVAYIDARDVMDLLDEVVGPENWESDYKELKGNLFAGIGIYLNDKWVWKWDCGTESQAEPEKGEASDSFKRAAVKWGIGRFLYELPVIFVTTNEKKNGNNYPYPVDENGKKIKNLTEYINRVKLKRQSVQSTAPAPSKSQDSDLSEALNAVRDCASLSELRSIWGTYKTKDKSYLSAREEKMKELLFNEFKDDICSCHTVSAANAVLANEKYKSLIDDFVYSAKVELYYNEKLPGIKRAEAEQKERKAKRAAEQAKKISSDDKEVIGV